MTLRRRRAPTGPTATASCCRPATRRSCCTRCSTSPATGSTLDDLEAFRQWGSTHARATPRCTTPPGVEVTTGPLGQGFANGGRHGASPSAGCGPGSAPTLVRPPHLRDLQRRRPRWRASATRRRRSPATSGSAASSYVYDDNHITIDGPTELRLHRRRRRALPRPTAGTSSELGEVANDLDALEAALRAGHGRRGPARRCIVLRSHIGYPSPKYTDTAEAHGNPLGADEIRATKEILGPPARRDVLRPRRRARALPRGRRAAARAAREAWDERLAALRAATATACDACLGRPRPRPAGRPSCPTWSAGRDGRHPQGAAARCLDAIVDVVPGLRRRRRRPHRQHRHRAQGPRRDQSRDDPGGRQIYFGVREHGMGATMNGMALHGGVLPVGGTFFVFSDYMRPAVRLAALSEAQGRLRCRPTTRSASARTARPTSRSSTSPSLRAMPGLRRDPPGRRQRDGRRPGGSPSTATGRPRSS